MRMRGLAVLAMAAALGACGQTPVPWTVATPGPTHVPSTAPTAVAAVSPPPSPSVAPSASVSAAPSVALPPPTPSAAGPSPSPVPGGWTYVGEKACPDGSEFTCVTLAVPRDHFATGGPTWDMSFAVHHATGRRVGTYVVITGGPGSSGIASADSYTSYFPASIPEHFDIVFLDQRGVGATKPIACPNAAEAFYAADVPDGYPAVDASFSAAAKTFAADCVKESGVDPADLPYYSTRQAVEDLEDVREYLGAAKIHLYGESYGTQYVQTYATSHPDRIAALYLDGPVDLSVDGATFLGEATRTFNDTFIATVNACRAERPCAADVAGVDLLAAYDDLVGRGRAGTLSLSFPMADGSTQQRSLTAGEVQMAAIDYLYSTGDRELLLRALAAAARGDLVPLARVVYASLLLDPETLKVVPDPTYSDAMYYAVECQDYVYNADAGSTPDRAAAFLAQGRANGAQGARFAAVYYDDMPCLFWPNTPTGDPRPAPIVAASYPTIVLVATTDPITPVENAIRIANRLTKATVIIQTGGPHVIFGWGRPCPDNPVADYMVSGKPFAGPLVTCPGSVADAYVPLAKPAATDYTDARAFLGDYADQVLNTNDYVDMLDTDPITMGCDFGGTLTYTPESSGTKLALKACAFTPTLAVSGSGAIDDSGGISLTVPLPGVGVLAYRRDADGKATLTGPPCSPATCLATGG
ncbi:MAG TPA: alpha/beta hydrolase [Acidimicrobiales bacterium]|nr:alpha/beta hydrolase [Acidimicrobiales bacterium]